MAQIKNTGTLKEIREAGNLQTGFDQIPTEASKAVVYTMEVNPKMFRRCNIVIGTQGANSNLTIYTTPSDKDFFLCGISASFVKNVTSDAAYGYIQVTINNRTVQPLYFAGITLTADSKDQIINFTNPIKLDRGTTLMFYDNAHTAGTCHKTASIWGYTVENQGA